MDAGTVLGYLEKVAPWLERVWKWITRREAELLRIVPNEAQTWWSGGATYGGKPAIQVLTQWFVTSRTSEPVRLVKARMVRHFPRRWVIWPLRRPKQVTRAIMIGFLHDHRRADDALPPGGHADMQAGFFPLGEPPADDQTLDGLITFVDHLGNEYDYSAKIRHVRRRHLGDEQPTK